MTDRVQPPPRVVLDDTTNTIVGMRDAADRPVTLGTGVLPSAVQALVSGAGNVGKPTTISRLAILGSSISSLTPYGGTVTANELWAKAASDWAAARGTSYVNAAVSGGYYNNFFAAAFTGLEFTANDVVLMELGFNNIRKFGAMPITCRDYFNATRALVAWAALPESAKIRTRTAAGTLLTTNVTRTGTWASWLDVLTGVGEYSSTSGASHTLTLTGHTLFISYARQSAVDSTFTVTVDGVVQGKLRSQSSYVPPTTSNNVDWEPAVHIITGLSDAAHTVVVTAGSTTPGVILWYGALSASTPAGPYVAVSNVLGMTNTGYAISGLAAANPAADTGNPALGLGAATATGAAQHAAAAQLQALGLRVAPCDLFSAYEPFSEVDTDDTHPAAIGHKRIWAAFKRLIA